MKPWLGGALVAAALLLCAGGLMLSRKSVSGMQLPGSSNNLPIIRLTLGDDYDKVLQQSTFHFPPRELGRLDLIGASEPVILEYTRPGASFTLPPARSFAASVDDRHVVSVTVSPQLQYISPEAAVDLVQRLGRLLQRSGWKSARRYLAYPEALARLESPAGDNDLVLRIEDWKRNDDEIGMEVSRQWRKEDSLPKLARKSFDFCVVSVKIDNDRVRAMYPGR